MRNAVLGRLASRLTPAVTVDHVEDTGAFERLRDDWTELLRSSAARTPFLTWEWLHAWWRHLAGSATLRIVCIRADGRLIALAPFMVRRPMALFSTLEFLGSGWAGSDYLDLIVRRGFERQAVGALAGVIGQDPMTLRLEHVPEDSVVAALSGQLTGERWDSRAVPGGTCPVIPLSGHTWDTYLGTLGSAHRANVRRRLRAIDREFEVRFETVTSHDERREALAALAGFHDRRFQTDGGSTAFLSPAMRAFQDEASASALDRGWLRMYVLRLGGDIAGVMYGFLYEGEFFFYQHGFDDRFKAQSAGLIVMAMSIRSAIEEGAQTFDMLWGVEPYKWLWARDTRALQLIHLFPPHARGRIHRRANDVRRHLGWLAKRVLAMGDACVS